MVLLRQSPANVGQVKHTNMAGIWQISPFLLAQIEFHRQATKKSPVNYGRLYFSEMVKANYSVLY